MTFIENYHNSPRSYPPFSVEILEHALNGIYSDRFLLAVSLAFSKKRNETGKLLHCMLYLYENPLVKRGFCGSLRLQVRTRSEK